MAGDGEDWKEYYVNRWVTPDIFACPLLTLNSHYSFVDRDMFMRYQYGMSVGHTYMHSLFPIPTLPSIPTDFDYCLQNLQPPVSHGSEPAQASSSSVTLTSNALGPELDDHRNGMDLADASGDVVMHDDDSFEVDQAEFGHADCDYLDDMDDREILVHEEMYGEI